MLFLPGLVAGRYIITEDWQLISFKTPRKKPPPPSAIASLFQVSCSMVTDNIMDSIFILIGLSVFCLDLYMHISLHDLPLKMKDMLVFSTQVSI